MVLTRLPTAGIAHDLRRDRALTFCQSAGAHRHRNAPLAGAHRVTGLATPRTARSRSNSPPSYDRDSARRYPAVYLLHGTTSDPREWLDGSYQGLDLSLAMDSLAAAGLSEYIVRHASRGQRFRRILLVNSTAFGRWEDFVVTELVLLHSMRDFVRCLNDEVAAWRGSPWVASARCTWPDRHAKTFGHVYAMSACCLGFVGELAPDSEEWATAGAPGSERWQPRSLRSRAVSNRPSLRQCRLSPIPPVESRRSNRCTGLE